MNLIHLDHVSIEDPMKYLLEWEKLIPDEINFPKTIQNVKPEHGYYYVYYTDVKCFALLSPDSEKYENIPTHTKLAKLNINLNCWEVLPIPLPSKNTQTNTITQPNTTQTYSPYNTQPNTDTHYKQQQIQPIQYTLTNNLNFNEGNIVKYITRHKLKNGIDDLKKVIHYTLFEAYHTYPEEFDNLIQWLKQEINP